jgi:hypothetical protein
VLPHRANRIVHIVLLALAVGHSLRRQRAPVTDDWNCTL